RGREASSADRPSKVCHGSPYESAESTGGTGASQKAPRCVALPLRDASRMSPAVSQPSEDARPSRLRSSHGALLLLGSVLLGIVYTAPLILHLSSAIPYATQAAPQQPQGLVPGDHLQFYYFLSLTDEMVRGRVPWFRDPY